MTLKGARKLAVILAVSGMALSACGNDESLSSGYRKAFTNALANQTTNPLTEAEAKCVAPDLVKALSAEALDKRKIKVATVKANTDFKALALNPDATQTNAIADAMLRCVDGGRSVGEAAKKLNSKLQFGGPARACLTKSLKTSVPFRDFTRTWVQGKPESSDSKAMAGIVADAYVSCGDIGAFVSGKLLTNNTPITPAQSACISKRAKASTALTQALTDLVSGSSLTALSTDDAAALGDVYIDCADIGAYQANQAAENNKAYKTTPAAVSCLSKAIRSGSDLRRSVRSTITAHDDDAFDDAIELEAFGDCKVDYFSKQDYVDAYATGISGSDAPIEITSEQGKCLADAFMTTYTVYELESAQVAPEDASDGEAFSDLYDGVTDAELAEFQRTAASCIDVTAVVRALMLELLVDSDIPRSFAECAANKLAENEEVRSAIVSALLGNQEFAETGSELGLEAGKACVR